MRRFSSMTQREAEMLDNASATIAFKALELAKQITAETLFVHRKCEHLISEELVWTDRTTNADKPDNHPNICDVCWHMAEGEMTVIEGYDRDETGRFYAMILDRANRENIIG